MLFLDKRTPEKGGVTNTPPCSTIHLPLTPLLLFPSPSLSSPLPLPLYIVSHSALFAKLETISALYKTPFSELSIASISALW